MSYTTAPVITLVGDTQITVEVEQHTKIWELQHQIIMMVISTADIVTLTQCRHISYWKLYFTYNVTDSSGNDATEVTRVVMLLILRHQ